MSTNSKTLQITPDADNKGQKTRDYKNKAKKSTKTAGEKVGVFICRCGGNISDKVDIEKLKSSINADFVEDYENLCSLNCRRHIREEVIDQNLDRVVIAACSPLTHLRTFQNYADPLNPYMVEMVNIREQCSWVHSDMEKATPKAIGLTQAGVEKVKKARPLKKIISRTEKSAAIFGGGISGITAALSLANQGLKVTIIEKNPTIGGNMVKIGKVFSPEKLAEECSLCILNPIINDVVNHKNIHIMTKTHLLRAGRRSSYFNLILEKDTSFVHEDRCIACGNCVDVCPVEVPDEWNQKMTMRKAIYKPFSQAVPDVYTIDVENCIKCGKCQKECNMNAIDFSLKSEVISLKAGSVIIATGHESFDLTKRPEYGYERFDDVISQMDLARILGVNGPTLGKLQKISDGKVPKRVVMIQCTGSRDEKTDGKRYCSKVCCMVALKHASIIREKFPETEVVICYTDLRTPGMYENYLRYVQDKGIQLIRGRPGEVSRRNGQLVVRVEDTLQRKPLEIETDMVVLSEAIEPSQGTMDLAKKLNVGLSQDLFIKEKHSKIKPANTDVERIFVCGTAQGPKDITDSVSQANAAAAKVSEQIKCGTEAEPPVAIIKTSRCSHCGKCREICGFKAVYQDEEFMSIDPMACRGCGACAGVCPEDAIEIKGLNDQELYAQIEGLLADKKEGEVRILTFLDNVGYTAADTIGNNRLTYPEAIRIIKIPSINRIMPEHIMFAFNHGADGILMAEYPDECMLEAHKAKIKELSEFVASKGIPADRLRFYKAYAPHYRGLAKQFEDFYKDLSAVEATK
ncbi:MAG: ferredoxin:CoB-CoM heterodisulfide reductase subunit HdrA [Methanobacteriaceae archaeon]|nr:ferredoxin:CoB-CoM heterodisulfide reductase subunit HdrA [Methanobacteriaceae archaeon]MDP2835409.1 ferredoxin:CoB-CoM heterodisulfide reductase subunit HdrA [Methanobacteriaceae archaeon]MDP3624131.1 ferredoxin:CoB-CoM heterodisulfide reductase subunit HdrA [Methanobacteriaceae archaeon]